MYAVEHYLKAIYDKLHRDLLQEEILHADETELQVLHEEGKNPQSKSYMWLYRTGALPAHRLFSIGTSETDGMADHKISLKDSQATFIAMAMRLTTSWTMSCLSVVLHMSDENLWKRLRRLRETGEAVILRTR